MEAYPPIRELIFTNSEETLVIPNPTGCSINFSGMAAFSRRGKGLRLEWNYDPKQQYVWSRCILPLFLFIMLDPSILF